MSKQTADRSGIESTVRLASADSVQKEAEVSGAEVCKWTFDTVEHPIAMSDRRGLINTIVQLFDNIARTHPALSNQELVAHILAEHAENNKLFQFITKTHPRMCKALLQRNRKPEVLHNILYMLSVKEQELNCNVSEDCKNTLVYKMQNKIFNECLTDTKPSL